MPTRNQVSETTKSKMEHTKSKTITLKTSVIKYLEDRGLRENRDLSNMLETIILKEMGKCIRLGEGNSNSKLTENDVLAMRQEFLKEKVSLKYLSDKYGVSASTIHLIIKRKRWANI